MSTSVSKISMNKLNFNSSERRYCVYSLYNNLNGKVYFGITNNYYRRMAEHRGKSRDAQPRQAIHKALRKYGIDNFSFDLLEDKLTVKEAVQKEMRLIALYNTTSKFYGYNLTKGGTQVHARVSGDAHPNKGKKISPHHKFETSKKGRKLSQSHIDFLSRLHSTRVRGEAERKSNSESSKRNWALGKNDSLKKRVTAIDSEGNMIHFESIQKAASTVNIASSSISRACSGKIKHCAGYKWTYTNNILN